VSGGGGIVMSVDIAFHLEPIFEVIEYFLSLNVRPGSPTLLKDSCTLTVYLYAALMFTRAALLRIQRFFGKRDALPEDQLALKAVMVDDMHSKLQTDLNALVASISDKIEDSSQRNKAAVSAVVRRKFSEIQALAARDDEADLQVNEGLGATKRLPKQQLLALVKDTVLFNFWSGNFFEESVAEGQKHIFQTYFNDAAGAEIRVIVRSPYRVLHDDSEELPYAIRIHHSNRKVLDLQWDPATSEQRDRSLKRGDWEQAILAWNVPSGIKPTLRPELVRERWSPPQLVEKVS
jgi:hypothetical protein